MYGFTREEAEGRVSHDLLRTEFSEPLQKIEEKFAADRYWAGELRHARANRSRITVSIQWVAERDARGKIASILEFNRDMSESNPYINLGAEQRSPKFVIRGYKLLTEVQ
jgi:PAS domain-containing protein